MAGEGTDGLRRPRVWAVPEHVWPDGRQAFLNLQDRPGLLLEPTRIIDLHVSDLADHHTHLDYAGTARRSCCTTPTG